MHAISYQLKRAHLVTTAFEQRAVKRIDGMTPARYNVLALLRERSIRLGVPKDNALNFMSQRRLVRALGLHHSTVSKMLTRMEEMGWIKRSRAIYDDRRVKIVELTELGLRRAWRAMRRVYRSRLLETPFERIARQLKPTMHVKEGLTSLWDTIDAIARFFNDRSFFTYRDPPIRNTYDFVDDRCPTAWTILAQLTHRGPRTSYERFLRRRQRLDSGKCRLKFYGVGAVECTATATAPTETVTPAGPIVTPAVRSCARALSARRIWTSPPCRRHFPRPARELPVTWLTTRTRTDSMSQPT